MGKSKELASSKDSGYTIASGNGHHVNLSTDGAIEIRRSGGNGYIDFHGSDVDYDVRIQHHNNGLAFNVGGDGNQITATTIDASGRVTMPYQPAFCHQGSGVQSFSGPASAWTFKMSHSAGLHVNRGNHYNYSTGVFTAPVAGAYKFTWQMAVDTGSTGPGAALVVNGAGVGEIAIGYYDAYATHGGSIIRELQANDTVYINVTNYNSTSFGLRLGRCIFSGHLIG